MDMLLARCGGLLWTAAPIVLQPSPRLGDTGVVLQAGVVLFGGAERFASLLHIELWNISEGGAGLWLSHLSVLEMMGRELDNGECGLMTDGVPLNDVWLAVQQGANTGNWVSIATPSSPPPRMNQLAG